MCSIEEAWGTAESQLIAHPKGMRLMDSHSSIGVYDKSSPHGTIPFTQNKSGVTANLVQQQMQMNQERQPDVAGQLYTQTDDRRQWAMPENDVVYDDFNRGLMAKPSPEANGLARGVHSKYSREKRFEARTVDGGVMGKLVTDVDPKYYERTAPTNIPPPNYMELYDRPFTEVGGIGMPLAANMNSEQFAEVNPQRAVNKFTPEIITDPRILAEANNVNHMVKPITDGNNKHNHTVKLNGSDDNNRNLAMGQISSQLRALMTKVEFLEKKMTTIEHDKSHDIVLFIVLAIFVMFILDNVFNKKMFS